MIGDTLFALFLATGVCWVVRELNSNEEVSVPNTLLYTSVLIVALVGLITVLSEVGKHDPCRRSSWVESPKETTSPKEYEPETRFQRSHSFTDAALQKLHG